MFRRILAPKSGISVSRILTRRFLASQEPEIILKDKFRPMRIDRELPDPTKDVNKRRLQFVGFIVLMTSALAMIFNYEKTQSPVISNTLYHMRRSPKIREVLGDQIDFDGLVPWVSGELNQVAGNVNIKFYLKGSKGTVGEVRLVADRENQHQEFFIHEWSVKVDDKKYDLLEESGGAKTL
ncbi:Coa1 [Kluyveromyces lactis]|nr:Coa1 [Kluyveromyces lactis]